MNESENFYYVQIQYKVEVYSYIQINTTNKNAIYFLFSLKHVQANLRDQLQIVALFT